MSLPNKYSLQEYAVSCHMKDVTTSGAGLCYAAVAAPFNARLTRAYMVQYAGVSGGASVVTTAINGTTVSGCTMTFASGTASPGYVYSSTPTDKSVTYVYEGGTISFTSDGGSANGTIPATFTAVLRRV